MGFSRFSSAATREADGAFLPYGEALAALGIDEGQLRELLTGGSLRGFRDEESLKFLRADVDAMRRRRRAGRG